MRLPSRHIKNKTTRQAVRFTIVGLSGTAVQYGLYYGLLMLFRYLWPAHELVNTAFTLAYVIEMMGNYVMTSYYTFGARPSMKNLGGFATARVFNYVLQIGLLHVCLMAQMTDEVAGIVSILISGVVNFFVTRIFFKEKKQKC